MMAALLRHQWRRHRAVLAVLPYAMFAFHWLISRIAPTPDQTAQFGSMLRLMPRAMNDAMGLYDPMSVTTRGVLAFGYVHPVPMLLMAMWTVRVAVGGLAGEIGMGTMDLVAARPVGRRQIVLSVALMLAFGLVLIAGAAWSGTAVGLVTRDLGTVSAAQFAPIAASLLLLFAAWGGIALAVSAAHKSGGGAIAIISGMMALTFALDYIARAWAPLRVLRPLSPFMYFEPQNSFRHGLGSGALVLAGLAVVGLTAAIMNFQRRDV